jgi:hypothetical protein
MDRNILQAIPVILVIISAIERRASATWKAEMKHDDALAVYRQQNPAIWRQLSPGTQRRCETKDKERKYVR